APPGAFGNVHPRWGGKANVGCFDGHAEALSPEELTDMRRWANQADRATSTPPDACVRLWGGQRIGHIVA
ncbi:MAG: hypothetical protein K2X56_13795, partial [Mycobacterium pseudokansasii]|uniref:hypothetical protein n=1 Tax=Mycobacterium pseudokansasii TaxID=2341080 RepID=UPI0023F0B4F0